MLLVMVIVGEPPAPITLRVNEELKTDDDIGPPLGTVGLVQSEEALAAKTVGLLPMMAKPKPKNANAINKTNVVAETFLKLDFIRSFSRESGL